jgi:hypothetical protein
MYSHPIVDCLPIRCLVLAGIWCIPVSAQTASFVCSPSSPLAAPGETIRLYAWANLPAGGKPIYAWTVSSGEVKPASGNIFTWKFGANSAAVSTADGELRTGSTVQARCLVEVQVLASQTNAPDSGLLTSSAQEPAGAGLYNYLLISIPLERANGEALRGVIRAWLALNAPVAELRRVLKPGEPIALGLPVLEKPTSKPDADWVLQHYDLPRARTLLEKIFPSGKPGIYIVSSLQPVSQSKPPYLIQDLSAATPALAASWVEAFINEAAQQRTWTPADEASLVDQLRATVLSIAREVPNIGLPLLMKWIALV